MKFNRISLLSLGLLTVLAFTSCKKDDTTQPVLTLKGSNPMTIDVGSSFTDPGATATDDVDGDISSSIGVTGTVDTSTVGTYTLTYTVSDEAGNVSTGTRTVNVEMSRDAATGNYHTTNNCPVPQSFVATATTFRAGANDDEFVIDMFYYNGGTLTCTLIGSEVQVNLGQAPNPQLLSVGGTGTFDAQGKVLTMNYLFDPAGQNVSCTVVYTKD